MESTSENLIETSESSQSTGAVAYATVMEEAKWNAGSLAKLRHIFDKIIKRFPMDVRKENGGIFDKWDTLLTTVDRCTHWEPKTSSYLNLRLQNPPEEDAMDVFNALFEEFAKQANRLLNDLPSPSDFAHPSVWYRAQKHAPILCLRPTRARGLPLITLHHVFLQFQLEALRPLSMTTDTVAAKVAAKDLCYTMGDSFETEEERGIAFDHCVSGVLEKGKAGYWLSSDSVIHGGKADRCIQEAKIPIALRQHELEFGSGGADAYIQIARTYHLLTIVLTDRAKTDINARSFLAHGAPCFLICLVGPILFVSGGFYDGHKPIVEPLARPVFMLDDFTRQRQAELASLLWALSRGLSSLRRLVTQPSEISFAPSTPRIYNTCTLFEPEGEVGTLTFVSRPNDAYQRILLATLKSSSIPDLQVLVKLVPRSYSREVHQHMAKNQLAPKLYGCAEVEGAPTAYVMEYLDPSIWQPLHEFLKFDATTVDLTQLRTAVDYIIDELQSEEYVHGDLRSSNIMIRTDVAEYFMDLRVIDFDWAGKAGQVCYPAERNATIQWPGEAGKPIMDDDDREMASSWLAEI